MFKCFNQVNNNILLSTADIKDNRNKKGEDSSPNNDISIPLDPQLFYKDFGYLLH